jgi:hypothetical protein
VTRFYVAPGDMVGLVSPNPKTKTNPRGAGRSPRASAAAANKVTIRLTDAEHAAYRDAASLADMTLGDWIRSCCEARLKRRRAAPAERGAV